MLDQFLCANRPELIERCALKVAGRPAAKPADDELQYGIPLFLDQLVNTLQIERMPDPMRSREDLSEIDVTAARHGVELLQHGFTVDQVVHDYGDLCQAITELAFERDVSIGTHEFRTLNRCLDN